MLKKKTSWSGKSSKKKIWKFEMKKAEGNYMTEKLFVKN